MSNNLPKFTTSKFDEGFVPEDLFTKELYNEVGAFAKQGQPILIFGPSGSGKEFLARHYYKVFAGTEFYKQYKQNWKTNYDSIKQKYSKYYSGESLKIFLESIKAGVFWSINAATIYPNLAESIIFGHEKKAFTDAETSPGLLEIMKYGVLFIDEIGELPKELQAKFLRVIDSEIREGMRMRGKMIYSINDLIIISATNQPREKLRDDFYYKLGIKVEIKGIDERPKDVRKSVPYFIRKAIDKRKDQISIAGVFGTSDQLNLYKLSETEHVMNFAEEQSNLIINEILLRKWPGNFRSLRNVLDAAILRIEEVNNLANFSKEFQNNFHRYKEVYSETNINSIISVDNAIRDSIFPSRYPDVDTRIEEEIINANVFPEMGAYEKKVLAVFLSATHNTGFKRQDLEKFYQKYNRIKHTSQSHIRNKINQLITNGILIRDGSSKSTGYRLTKEFLEKVQLSNSRIFSLPEINKKWTNRDTEIEALEILLHNSDRLYIQGPSLYGKSAFITMFCNARNKLYNFYYYALGETGIKEFFKYVSEHIQPKNIVLSDNELYTDPVNKIYPFLEKLFEPSEKFKPVLILDNVHFISNADDKRIILELSKKWKDVIIILIGNKMDNAFLEDYYEFPLSPWGKQT